MFDRKKTSSHILVTACLAGVLQLIPHSSSSARQCTVNEVYLKAIFQGTYARGRGAPARELANFTYPAYFGPFQVSQNSKPNKPPYTYSNFGHGIFSAWGVYGSQVLGQGIKIGLIDGAVDLEHPDLPHIEDLMAETVDEVIKHNKWSRPFKTGRKIRQTKMCRKTGNTLQSSCEKLPHGTASIGIILAQNNGQGYVGIAPRATGVFASNAAEPGSENDAGLVAALTKLIKKLGKGDVVLIEAQGPIAGVGQGGPAILYPSVYGLVEQASKKGIAVVVGAGNAGVGIDSKSVLDSSAIIVGASDPSKNKPELLNGSATKTNFGTAVRVHAWGVGIQTTGYSFDQDVGAQNDYENFRATFPEWANEKFQIPADWDGWDNNRNTPISGLAAFRYMVAKKAEIWGKIRDAKLAKLGEFQKASELVERIRKKSNNSNQGSQTGHSLASAVAAADDQRANAVKAEQQELEKIRNSIPFSCSNPFVNDASARTNIDWEKDETSQEIYDRMFRKGWAFYTDDFGGTSGASAIVAGIAVAIQSYAKANFSDTLSPFMLRLLLMTSGQIGPKAGAKTIGRHVHLYKAIEMLETFPYAFGLAKK